MHKTDVPWGRFASEPVFVLTADQDWAPEWAIATLLEHVQKWKLPLHIFRTSPSALLDDAARNGAIEQGWHPNFMTASTHGSTPEEVVEYCQRLFPGARTSRSHCFAEDSFRIRALVRAGIVADSQNPTACQGFLVPMIHPSGLLRLPVYFEDDCAFDAVDSYTVDVFRKTLFTPGLKIVNFHPTFVGCNTPSQLHYSSVRSKVFNTEQPAEGVRWNGRGTANMFDELIGEIVSAGHRFGTLHSLVDETLKYLDEHPEMLPKGSVLRR